MGFNLFEKIVQTHHRAGDLRPGAEIAIAIDQTLTQDALGTMAYLQFEAMGIPRARTRLSVSYVDHCLLQEGFENADDHLYLQTVAAAYGLHFSKPGNGICHQVHLERFSRPGETLLGADSHTPTCGAVAMLAIGAGGLDVAVAMAGGPFYLTYPQVVRVHLHGQLPPWSTAKDLILVLLKRLTTKGNGGKVLEFAGPGVATLSVPERATITNMGAELGVTTSLFPSDGVTRQFFAAQGREDQWQELLPDPDARYTETLDMDLRTIEPQVALPHSPDQVCPVREAGPLKVDQVLVGSCTNGSYRDLMTVAAMVKGRRVHPEVSFGVAAGSRQVFRMIAEKGALQDLLDAGARLLEPACGFCAGYGQAPRSGGVSVRTNNRNFQGRSGTQDAQVYLASPEVAAATALTGQLTDPRDLGLAPPSIPLPERFFLHDGLVIPPRKGGGTVVRGPNIGEPPRQTPLPERLRARIAIKVGDKVTTDHIIPAGPVSRYRSNIPRSSDFIFHHLDPAFAERCRSHQREGLASVIVAGLSYGQGSSREHAALCPAYLGVRAVIARGIERIHLANLVNFGILPLLFTDPKDYEALRPGDTLCLDDTRALSARSVLQVQNLSQGSCFEVSHSLSPRQLEILYQGGLLNHTSAALPRG